MQGSAKPEQAGVTLVPAGGTADFSSGTSRVKQSSTRTALILAIWHLSFTSQPILPPGEGKEQFPQDKPPRGTGEVQIRCFPN